MCVNAINAQDADKQFRMGSGGFTIGASNMDISALQSFVPGSLRTFNNQQMLLGGTGHGFIDRFVIGGSGFAATGDAISTDTFSYRLSGGVGTFDFGYLIYNKDKLKIYPMLGIGGGGYGIGINRIKNLSSSQISSNPEREININNGGFVMDISLNINVIPVLNHDKNDDSYGGFMTGLKIGYIHGFRNSNWTYTGGSVTDGPMFGMKMFYAKLIIGGFGYSKSK